MGQNLPDLNQISPSSEAILAAQSVQKPLLQRGKNVLRNLPTSTAANTQLDPFFKNINKLLDNLGAVKTVFSDFQSIRNNIWLPVQHTLMLYITLHKT